MYTLAKVVRDVVADSLKSTITNCQVRVVNNSVVIDEDAIHLYIRVLSLPDRNRVEISNICIHDESMKRSGLFTCIMQRLKEVQEIDELFVTSVLTAEMKAWCVKHNCKLINDFDYKYK